jgi:hypothetical protein
MHVSLRLYRSLQTVHPKPETRTNLHAPRLPLLPVRCYRLIAWASAFLLAGCAVVGPPSIRNGRSVYNDAINDTNNQQLLMAIIRGRYSENASLLAVNSITANFSVATSAGIQFGFGNESNYAGNLVPFSASAVYEENPTVSYAPVEGQKYLRQLTSPVPLSLLVPLSESAVYPGALFTVLVARVNDLANPLFVPSSSGPDPGFTRFVQLVTQLGQAEVLNWVDETPRRGGYTVVIHHFSPRYDAESRELLRLLGLPGPPAAANEVVIPVSQGPGDGAGERIVITTRSVYDLMEIFSAAVDIPPDDIASGAAINYPPTGILGARLHILRSRTEPENAYVTVKYHGWWYYIDKTDQPTKQFFQLLTVLWSATIAETTNRAQKAPILMLPASR